MQTNSRHPPLRTPWWRALWLAIYAFIALVAPVCIAQPAINSIANSNSLPLKNMLIEVRQVQHNDRQSTATQARADLRIEGRSGGFEAQGQLQARQGQGQQSDAATQQVLVLNGRSARIDLVTRTPMRVLQSFVRNGTLVVVPGTLVLDATTGFTATPRWNGSDSVELEIAASQAASAGNPTMQTNSMLAVPLGTWVTMAQSDTQSDGQRTVSGGQAQWSEQANSEVQVRVTLR